MPLDRKSKIEKKKKKKEKKEKGGTWR